MNQKETKQFGSFHTNDKNSTAVRLEWQKTTLFALEFAAAMQEAWPLARAAYTPVEMQFLRTYPEVVDTEDYFKPFEPLFKNGLATVDWAKAEEIMQALLKTHFIFDATTWGPEVLAQFAQDVCYVITIRDHQTNTLLGFITFMIRPAYAPGNIKIMALAVDPAHQNRGLGKLLTSAIFRISPKIRRVFLCTRVTNNTALAAYRAWGFVTEENPTLDHAFNLKHWTFMEYKTEKSDVLQKVAATLIE